jgi:hypothetical protein
MQGSQAPASAPNSKPTRSSGANNFLREQEGRVKTFSYCNSSSYGNQSGFAFSFGDGTELRISMSLPEGRAMAKTVVKAAAKNWKLLVKFELTKAANLVYMVQTFVEYPRV